MSSKINYSGKILNFDDNATKEVEPSHINNNMNYYNSEIDDLEFNYEKTISSAKIDIFHSYYNYNK